MGASTQVKNSGVATAVTCESGLRGAARHVAQSAWRAGAAKLRAPRALRWPRRAGAAPREPTARCGCPGARHVARCNSAPERPAQSVWPAEIKRKRRRAALRTRRGIPGPLRAGPRQSCRSCMASSYSSSNRPDLALAETEQTLPASCRVASRAACSFLLPL